MPDPWQASATGGNSWGLVVVLLIVGAGSAKESNSEVLFFLTAHFLFPDDIHPQPTALRCPHQSIAKECVRNTRYVDH